MSRYKAYAEYKDSGVEWLGPIPSHWKLSPLKYLAEFSGGGTPSKDNKKFWNGNIPWVSPKDMKVPRIVSTIDNITESAIKQSSTNLLEKGALLMVVRSGILQHSIPVAINDVAVSLNQDMKALRFSISAFSEYALYFVTGNQSSLLLEWSKEGATVESIEHEYLANTLFPCPPQKDRTAIIDFLDYETAKIDALIEKQQRLIRLLKEKRQAVISHAVTKGLNPDAPMKDSGVEWLGEVPAHWEVLAIKHIVSTPITDGPHETPEFFDDGIPFVSAEAVSSGYIDFSKIRAHISEEDDMRFSKKYSPKRFDIFMVKSGATTGVTAIVEEERRFNIWSPLAVIRCDESSYPYFVLNFLRSRNFIQAIELNWSFGTQQNIGMKVIENLHITRPRLDEAENIANLLQDTKILESNVI